MADGRKFEATVARVSEVRTGTGWLRVEFEREPGRASIPPDAYVHRQNYPDPDYWPPKPGDVLEVRAATSIVGVRARPRKAKGG